MKLIVGCGYLGLRVAKRWVGGGTRGRGRRAERGERGGAGRGGDPPDRGRCHAAGDAARLAGRRYAALLRGLPQRSRAIRAGPVYVDGLCAALDAVSPDVRRVIFISSTGVYAEENGGWVDEDSPCGPCARVGPRALGRGAGARVASAGRSRNRLAPGGHLWAGPLAAAGGTCFQRSIGRSHRTLHQPDSR